jgi:hypothetical protein
MSEYDYEGGFDDFGDEWDDEPVADYEAGANWRAQAGASQVLREDRLAAEGTEAVMNRQRELNRLGTPGEVASAADAALVEQATEALAQGYTAEDIRQAIEANPWLGAELLDNAIEATHWQHLTEKMRQQIRGGRR